MSDDLKVNLAFLAVLIVALLKGADKEMIILSVVMINFIHNIFKEEKEKLLNV